ncbi:MAG: NAD(P)-dependent oxidoreductase [Planctomycetes bacterium]|nr:NAD(P)-dependent oxidoreductase [Planctomycetota bacterium]
MSELKTVLVTGSAGTIGRAVVSAFRDRYELRCFDRVPTPSVADAVAGDLADLEAVKSAMRGVDTVVHLAATPDEADFLSQLLPNNIIGAYNVFEAARQSGVQRVVAASTAQLAGLSQKVRFVRTDMAPGGTTIYAATKLFAEGLGRAYAHRYGLSVIMARLGWCPRPGQDTSSISKSEVGQANYLSPGDVGRFFVCAVEARGIRYEVFYVTSRPPGKPYLDIEPARRLLGYEPQDAWTGLHPNSSP